MTRFTNIISQITVSNVAVISIEPCICSDKFSCFEKCFLEEIKQYLLNAIILLFQNSTNSIFSTQIGLVSVSLSNRFGYLISYCFYTHSSSVNRPSPCCEEKMNTATRVQILDETDCISHSTNTLGKGMNLMNLIILPPAMDK